MADHQEPFAPTFTGPEAAAVLDRPDAGGGGGGRNSRAISPFRNILRLITGDFAAKALYFVTFVYLAKTLGVAGYGVLEFAVAIRTYLLLLADGGLEMWAVREVAKGKEIRRLAARVVPLRAILAVASYAAVTSVLGILPDNPNLRKLLPVLALTVFLQAFNLKWVFMGTGKMSHVGAGLVLAQGAFSALMFLVVRGPGDLMSIGTVWLTSELVLILYFRWLFAKRYGSLPVRIELSGVIKTLRPALVLGLSQGLGLLNYGVGSVLLGVLRGPGVVGWYGAAYKPVTAALALPASFFGGLFPALATAHAQGREAFRALLARSLRLTSIFAIPIGIGGTLLAEPMIRSLFGPTYLRSVAALQILAWSAVLVILRGNFRQALNVAGRHRLDLYCAGAAVTTNFVLNLVLIPRYSLLGAASAALLTEVLWFTIAFFCVSRYVTTVPWLDVAWRPVLAAAAMAAALWLAEPWYWMVRAALGGAVYFTVLGLLGETEVLVRLPFRSAAPVPEG